MSASVPNSPMTGGASNNTASSLLSHVKKGKEKKAQNREMKKSGIITTWTTTAGIPKEVEERLKKGSVSVSCNAKGKCSIRPIVKPPGGSSTPLKVMTAVRRGLKIDDPNMDPKVAREAAAEWVRRQSLSFANLDPISKQKGWAKILENITKDHPEWVAAEKEVKKYNSEAASANKAANVIDTLVVASS